MKRDLSLVIVGGIALLCGGCSGRGPVELPSFFSNVLTPQAPQVLASPLATISPLLPATQGQAASSNVKVQAFVIERPVKPGALEIRGTGPSGVPIAVNDLTFGGATLGTGVIGADGHFTLKLSQPVPADHRIGLTTGDLAGTAFKARDFQLPGFNGPQAMNYPQIGFFFDTEMVR